MKFTVTEGGIVFDVDEIPMAECVKVLERISREMHARDGDDLPDDDQRARMLARVMEEAQTVKP